MRVVINPSVPDQHKDEVMSKLSKVIHLFPGWCQEITLCYMQENPDGFVLSIACEYPYRYVQINVFDRFFTEPMWENALIHEIMHSIFSPYTRKVDFVLGHFIKDPTLQTYLRQEFIDAEECVAQDLAEFHYKLTSSEESVNIEIHE